MRNAAASYNRLRDIYSHLTLMVYAFAVCPRSRSGAGYLIRLPHFPASCWSLGAGVAKYPRDSLLLHVRLLPSLVP